MNNTVVKYVVEISETILGKMGEPDRDVLHNAYIVVATKDEAIETGRKLITEMLDDTPEELGLRVSATPLGEYVDNLIVAGKGVLRIINQKGV